MSLIRRSLIFSTATLVSRVVGMFRDISLATVYGAGKVLDSYFVSIVFPFFFRKIFGEGALTSSFVPHYKTSKNRDEFTSSVLNNLGLMTFGIVIVVEIFPQIVPYMFAPGYSHEEILQMENLVRVSALLIPIIFFWATFYSILNSHGRFFLPAVTPVFMNLGVILGTLIGRNTLWSVTGFVLGGIASTVALGTEASKYFKYRFTFRGIGNFLPDFLKATVSVMTNQFNLLVDTMVASFLGSGVVSSIQLSSRLYQLPIGLFAVAVSTVSLVEMTERDARKDAVSAALFLSLPSSVGLFVLSDGIVNLLYSFGNFSKGAAHMTSEILKMYSIGVVFYSIYLVSLRYHHSAKRMGVPFIASLVVSGTNAALDFPLGFSIGAKGIALATSIASVFGVIFFILRKEVVIDIVETIKITISSSFVGVTAWILRGSGGRIETILAISASIVVYIVSMKILRSSTLVEILRRR